MVRQWIRALALLSLATLLLAAPVASAIPPSRGDADPAWETGPMSLIGRLFALFAADGDDAQPGAAPSAPAADSGGAGGSSGDAGAGMDPNG